MGYKVAIDGPSASGKSSVCKKLAKALNFKHIDTGLMYRLVTYLALKQDKDLNLESTYQFLDNIVFDIVDERLYFEGKDITDTVRTPEIDKNISLVSSLGFVRDKLVEIQRKFAEKENVLMDGRDIATVVLPDADIKIFLTASVEERAKRRYIENKEKHINEKLEDVKSSIVLRDLKDSTRKLAPLKKAKDAIEVDNTGWSLDELFNYIYNIIVEKLNLKIKK